MTNRTRLKPISDDWTLCMIEEMNQYLVSPDIVRKYKRNNIDIWADLIAGKLCMIVDEHIYKNEYELRKIKNNDRNRHC